jgi:hypothetical protein
MQNDWTFDQAKNVAAITTRQALREGLPILCVVHYGDDHSWSFTCGTTNDPSDALVVSMECIVEHDPTLIDIANLPPGWGAYREPWGANGSATRWSRPSEYSAICICLTPTANIQQTRGSY